MFGIEDKEEEGQDAKTQVLQEILDFAREKMMSGAKGKMPEGGMSLEISSESPEGMDAEEKPMEGSGEKMCPHCGKPC